MIVVESVDSGLKERRYSDEGNFIRQVETGVLYEDAVDVAPSRFTYEETTTPIHVPILEEKAAAYDILVGGSKDDNN